MSDRILRSGKAAVSERARSELTVQLWNRLNSCKEKAKATTEANKIYIEENRMAGRKRSPNCPLKISGTAIHDFNEMGYQNYLGRSKLQDVSMDASTKMFSQFISYIKEKHQREIKGIKGTKHLLLWVIDSRRDVFGAHIDDLEVMPANKRQRIEAIINAVSFLEDRNRNEEHAFSDALRVLVNLKKQLTKAARVDTRSKKDREERVRIHAYPRGGLKQIRANLHDGWDYFDALVAVAQAGYQLKESEYNECLRYVLATLWGYDGNARSLAIEELCLDDVQIKLEGRDFVLSQKFKTFGHYDHQVVKFSLIISEVWVPFIRSQATTRRESDRVFVKYNGMPLQHNETTRHVQEYFKRYGLVLNVTTLRSVLEESYLVAETDGLISERARASLTLSQGHSERTAEEYYLLGKPAARSITKGVADADAFEAICASADLLLEPLEMPPDIDSRVRNVRARTDTYAGVLEASSCFGLAYTGKATNGGKRYEWTLEELKWIEGWYVMQGADIKLNRYSSCLRDLHQEVPSVKALFHPHHVESSDRFKNGAMKVERLLGFVSK